MKKKPSIPDTIIDTVEFVMTAFNFVFFAVFALILIPVWVPVYLWKRYHRK